MTTKKLYTVIIFSENTVGLLNQITIIFTRRQLNIETLSVSPSAIQGIHKFTITTFADEDMIDKVVKQIDKRVDILKAYYNTDEDLVFQEIALYKLSTELFIKMGTVENLIRKYNARILEMNETCVVLEKSGHYDETQALFRELSETIGVLQFIRSGRVAITKSRVERLSDMLAEFHFVTEPYLLDFRGRVTIPMIGNYLIHVASSHAAERGFGFNDMSERHTAWVLSRLAIEMIEYPAMSEPITLYTWVDEVGRLFTSRCFELVDGNGKTFGYARSIWAAIDVETRRPTLLDIARLSAYVTDRPCPIEKPGKIAAVENETEGVPYFIKYSDLDINGHLNSIKYMEHLLDLFDLDLFKTKDIKRFEIAYQSEGKYGMKLMLYKREADNGKYDMAICNEGKAICRAAVMWH